ncbi:DTW domain containing protein [Minicystis rosea]|nr:DTW domain containing protein [Minicystis rosea]
MSAPNDRILRANGPELAASPRARRGALRADLARGHRCTGCGLIHADCLCAALTAIPVRTRVALIIHRAEIRKSTNTGRLAARLLAGAEIRLRGEHDPEARTPLPEGRRLLLYPLPGARLLSPIDGHGEPPVLIVPDGNWPQARRAALRDPDAAGAEAVVLPPGPPSRYRLRAAPREDALSTMEAVARAMGILEGAEVERRLMEAFDVFVARSMRAAGRTPSSPADAVFDDDRSD